jgi:hypothetical protein
MIDSNNHDSLMMELLECVPNRHTYIKRTMEFEAFIGDIGMCAYIKRTTMTIVLPNTISRRLEEQQETE